MKRRTSHAGALYPREIEVTLTALRGAFASLGEFTGVNPHTARQCLAEYIAAHALFGELDEDGLREGALKHLRSRFSVLTPADRRPGRMVTRLALGAPSRRSGP